MFKPAGCERCPHYSWPGFSKPDGTGSYGVLLVGDHGAGDEHPFAGRAGGLLNKLLGHAGLDRSGFRVTNAVSCRPPDLKLLGMPWESSAVSECGRRHLLPMIAAEAPKVIVPMGPLALLALLGRRDVLDARGYPWPSARGLIYPTVHPTFIMAGNGEYGTVFIHDMQRAVELARDGWTPAATHYLLDPPPEAALRWADEYVRALANDPTSHLAYDIETAWGSSKDDQKEEGALDDTDQSWIITRIGFSYQAHTALSLPWSGEYRAAIQRVLGTLGPKIVWNDAFDTPRIRAAGVRLCGPIHDGMVAWHVLQSDLPKRLGFVASMVLDDQPAWKHLSSAMPAHYNAADADIEWRATHTIFDRLRAAGLWSVYDRHIVQLAPLLSRLSARGMPIDQERRETFARQLATRQAELRASMEAQVPEAARSIAHVYTSEKKPAESPTLRSRPKVRQVRVCAVCGHPKPTKSHFRTLLRPTAKRPQNPCADAATSLCDVESVEWYRLGDWTPSNPQLTAYALYRKHTLPKRRAGDAWRVSFDADGISRQVLKYPTDPLYPLVLQYREVDKLAGTYIGRPSEALCL